MRKFNQEINILLPFLSQELSLELIKQKPEPEKLKMSPLENTCWVQFLDKKSRARVECDL